LAAIQRELNTERTIQHSLVPRTFPPFPERTDFDIHAQMTSALAVGRAVEPIAEVGGVPLGLFDGMEYTGSSVHLRQDDTLFLYTDGVPEARNAGEDDFTDESLIATLGGHTATSCRDLISYVAHKVSAFTDGAPQSDDITMLSVKRLRN
jgi:sigma-B regulation protein RsbU (phosphoserine phosphatase)